MARSVQREEALSCAMSQRVLAELVRFVGAKVHWRGRAYPELVALGERRHLLRVQRGCWEGAAATGEGATAAT
eukprot:9776043-Alexandrium_andersonii.AAC.1